MSRRKSVYVSKRRDLPERPGDFPGVNRITAEVRLFYPPQATHYEAQSLLRDAFLKAQSELEDAFYPQDVAVS